MKPETCKGCPLEVIGEGWVPPQLSGKSPLLVVGEAPGQTEARTGLPFSGKSGRFLDGLLRRTGIRREDISVANTICCRPPSNELKGMPWEEGALAKCAMHLDRAIDQVKPKAILGLGDSALKRLSGRSGIQRLRGFVMIGPRAIPTVCTFHPAYLLPGRTRAELAKKADRPSRFLGVVGLDIRRAWGIATQEGPFLRVPQRYTLDPNPGEAATWAYQYEQALARNPRLLLTWDIETPGKQGKVLDRLPMLEQPIIRIAFAYEAGNALSVPWEPAYLTTIRRLLATTGDSTGWNSYGFDNPIIERHLGGPFLRGRHYDMMRAWHVFQSDLPKNLESVASVFTTLFPWKDLSGSNPALYNATDADAQIQLSYGLRDNLQPRGQWDIVERLVRQLHPILREAGERGLPVEREIHERLRRVYERELLQVVVSGQTPEVLPYANDKLYVREPTDVPTIPITVEALQKECTCGALKPSIVHYREAKKRAACPGQPVEVMRPLTRYRQVLSADLLERPLEEALDQIRDCGFNLLSPSQVMAYAEGQRHAQLLGLKNMDDTALDTLVKRYRDPVYKRVKQARALSKKLGTYIMGYQPGASGRIYTTYNDNPSTLRIGSSDVNTQNVPDEIRQMIVAPPGFTWVEGDSSAIEAVLVGYCARDPEYVRLAARGIHDFLNCTAQRIPFNEEGILRSKTEFKEPRKRKKMTVHLSNYGGTPRMMVMQAPDVYPDVDIAKAEQDFYFSFCPKIREWQKQTRALANRTHMLVHEWGFHQYFHEVFDGDEPGQDYNRCLGARPQSLGAFIMRENLLLVGASEWRTRMHANCNTHDSLALLVPTEEVPRAIDFLEEVLTRPIPQLDNLRIGCEIKVSGASRSWKDMQVVRAVRLEDPLALSSWHRALAQVSA